MNIISLVATFSLIAIYSINLILSTRREKRLLKQIQDLQEEMIKQYNEHTEIKEFCIKNILVISIEKEDYEMAELCKKLLSSNANRKIEAK